MDFFTKIKFSMLTALFLAAMTVSAQDPISDQITRYKIVDNGGSGRYKAIVCGEKTLNDFTVYRPRNVKAAARREGPLPILIWWNGACSGSNVGYERMLNEIASHGYVVLAVGSFRMNDNEDGTPGSSEQMSNDAINWLVSQEKLSTSQYYKAINVNNIAVSGHSCGGAQAIANCANSRVKTLLIMNSGMGAGVYMGGASPQTLNDLHCPIIYMSGGPGDVAYGNAEYDFNVNVKNVPVTWADLPNAGHGGTYWDMYGGEFGKVAVKWMDWRLKGYTQNARLFLKSELRAFPSWNIGNHNYGNEDCDAPFQPEETVTKQAFSREAAEETFAFGADVTMMKSMEDAGRIFYNRDGKKLALMPILKEEGINSVRLQVLVNPADNIANVSYIRTVALKARAQGFSVLLDINFSDVWANSGAQTKPEKWEGHNIDQLVEDVYNYTQRTVKLVKGNGVQLCGIQLGNEVDDGILWEEGRRSTNLANFVRLMNSAYDAIKEIDPELVTIVHMGECINTNMLMRNLDAAQNAGLKFDAIGLSAYPSFYSYRTSAFISRVANNVTTLKTHYEKPVFIVETGYYNDRPLEANNFLCDFLKALIDAGASGLYYWEPEMYDDYTLGAWNPLTNRPSIALDAFNGLRHSIYDPTSIEAPQTGKPAISIDGNTIAIDADAQLQYIRIYTVAGQLIKQYKADGNQQMEIQLPAGATGNTLLIQVVTDKGSYTQIATQR